MARRRRKVGIYRGREGGEGVRECGRGAVRDGRVGWAAGRRGQWTHTIPHGHSHITVSM